MHRKRFASRALALTGLLTLSQLAMASPKSDFPQCVAALQQKATQNGISKPVVDNVLGQVQYRKRVIHADRHQPEFTETFAHYLNLRVTDYRVAQGRKLLQQHKQLLAKLTRQYGVPGQYLIAFWGMETGYGHFFGKVPILDSLATLACDPRRSSFFTDQLMDALKIVDRGDVKPKEMEGSWAGAMGNFQFMPSVFLKYAVDENGDGRRDLWNSLPDAMASAANFIQGLGWQTGLRWGREVRLPPHFAYYKAGLNKPRTLKAWEALGVRTNSGKPLPDEDIKASLLIPSGHGGPAFLVYQNFNVIMRWNNSEFYALSVGILADRIAGAQPLRVAPPQEPALTRDRVLQMQKALNAKGFESGHPDGIMGPATRDAIRAFQHKNNMIADGYPSGKVLNELGLSSPPQQTNPDPGRH